MPRARSGEAWMCENWLDLPYSPVKAQERRGGPMTTMQITPDAFGTMLSFPLNYKCQERVDEPNPWKPYTSADGAGAQSAPVAPHGTQWLEAPKVTMQQVSYVDPSPQRDVTKKHLNFNDFNRALAWEQASKSMPLLQTQSLQKEHFVDRITGHREALKPAETVWTKAFAREKARQEMLLRGEGASPSPSKTAPTAFGRLRNEPKMLEAARAREARQKHGNTMSRTSNSMPWHSASEASAARSAPPEWSTREYGKLSRSNPSLLKQSSQESPRPKMKIRS
eukprot:TRINITY_DN36297_c0_g1_i1.p1 TRINITY_DN36297_c0_g1~~TRINITY_DN36297_c0_g1_i1.p1  ORF type:complete len:314 (-),score=56.08 TRINITY_DN36297_c0_g1_i1:350-1189(-)